MFKIVKRSRISRARAGIVRTAHGAIKTPFFMPDATRAVLKLCSADEIKALGLPALVVNTFHLYLQPGSELIRQAGGVHKFMDWERPLLSDSGGFQVFSLIHQNPKMGKIGENEVFFKSPLDGSSHVLSPESSINIQFDLGVDMMVVLDDCPPHDASGKKMQAAIRHTIAWAGRCRIEYDRQIKKRKIGADKRPLLFGVVQGGLDEDLRRHCARALVEIGFDGYGFGARPVDADGNFAEAVLRVTAEAVPEKSLRFGLGIGTPEDIVRCVLLGWDMFDCVIPSREGRHGRLFEPIFNFRSLIFKKQNSQTFYKTININNSRFRDDFSAINQNSRLSALRGYSRSYLHHLFKVGDPLGQRLVSLNNLEFYNDLMTALRKAIIKGEH